MRPLEILLCGVNLAAWLSLGSPRIRATSGLRALAAVSPVVVAAGQFVLEGPRWQLVPAYALSWLALLGWRGRRRSRWVPGVGVLVWVLSLVAPVLLPVFRFPPPTGRYAIGTVTCHWVDQTRSDVFVADPSVRRELLVQIWYPAATAGNSPAAYLTNSREVTRAIARFVQLPAALLAHFRYVRTHAIPSARAADDEGGFPVLLFLEGANGFRQMNTYQVEELVSHGYVVVALDQPHTAATVVFPDGHEVEGIPFDVMKPLIRQSYAPVDTAPTLDGRPIEDGIIAYLAQDVVFVLDELARLQRADPGGILTGRMDLERAGAFGVSLGGIVAGEACRAEPRLRACLIMDAPMPADAVQAGLHQPILWLSRSADAMRLEGWSELDIDEHLGTMQAGYQSLRGDGYLVQIAGLFHVNLTDVPLWSPVSRWAGVGGPIDPQRAHRIVNAYSLAFFDRHLRDQGGALLNGPAEAYPEVSLQVRRLQSAGSKEDR